MYMKKIITIILILALIIGAILFINNYNTKNKKLSENIPSRNDTIAQTYKMDEVIKHSTKEDCWIIINKKVVNVTDFIASGQHNDQILQGCGKDATEMFKDVGKHSGRKAQSMLSQFEIGVLE